MTGGKVVSIVECDDNRHDTVYHRQTVELATRLLQVRAKVPAAPQADVPSPDLAIACADIGQQHVQTMREVCSLSARIIRPEWRPYQGCVMTGHRVDICDAVGKRLIELRSVEVTMIFVPAHRAAMQRKDLALVAGATQKLLPERRTPGAGAACLHEKHRFDLRLHRVFCELLEDRSGWIVRPREARPVIESQQEADRTQRPGRSLAKKKRTLTRQ